MRDLLKESSTTPMNNSKAFIKSIFGTLQIPYKISVEYNTVKSDDHIQLIKVHQIRYEYLVKRFPDGNGRMKNDSSDDLPSFKKLDREQQSECIRIMKNNENTQNSRKFDISFTVHADSTFVMLLIHNTGDKSYTQIGYLSK
jgi:hypothetical protein